MRDLTSSRHNIKFMFGSCLDRLKDIPDGSVDAIITDPPYGTTVCKWDKIIPYGSMWEELLRCIRPDGPIVLFASQPFTSMLVASNPKLFRYSWIWSKNKGTGHLNAKRMPMKYHEDIVVFSARPHRYFPQDTVGHAPMSAARNKQNNINGAHNSVETLGGSTTRKPRSVLEFTVVNNDGTTDGGRFHESQKPVALMKYLVETYTEVGDVVLDFTMGSGSTGVACVKSGRGFIGIEDNEKHYMNSVRRMKSAIKSLKVL